VYEVCQKDWPSAAARFGQGQGMTMLATAMTKCLANAIT